MLIKLNKIILISPKLYSYYGAFSKQKWWKMPLSLKKMSLDSGKTFSSSFSNHPAFGITPLDCYLKGSEQQFFTLVTPIFVEAFIVCFMGLRWRKDLMPAFITEIKPENGWMYHLIVFLLCFCFLDFLINWLIFLAKMFKQNKNSRKGRVVWVNELKSDE